MSYILDALRRAEAERERGSVPGLHTQPVAPPAATEPTARTAPALAWGAALLALLLLLAAVAWLLLTRPAAPEPAPAPAPVAAQRVVPPPPAPVVAIAPAEAVKVVPVAPAPQPAPSRPATAASSAATPPSIALWERLSEAQRRQLPTLAVSGAIWSESAANRMLIVSGQLLHEGDTVAPGVTLEQVRPKSAVLKKGELRYEISF